MRKVNSMTLVEARRKLILEELKGEDPVDMLSKMMALQKIFGSKFVPFGRLTIEQKEKWTKEFVVCCMDELSEVLNWTNWKHWKKPVYPVNELKLKYELVDLWHFLMSLMLVWGMTSTELYSMYLAKNEENHARQTRGY